MSAARHWADQLAAWAIPDHILALAPESPWAFTPALFAAPADPGPDTPSRRRARDAVPPGGVVLDVGCGGGAASLPLVPPAGRVVGFDEGADLLAAFSEGAARLGVDHQAVRGRWPDLAAAVEPADVVVCHHVVYNVADLAPFAAELTGHARRRVVVELTADHPRAGVNPLWRHFWGIDRPDGPTADDAVAVLVEAGLQPTWERAPRPPRPSAGAQRVASVRRYLCLPPEREAEVEAQLELLTAPPGEVVTLWWDGSASS